MKHRSLITPSLATKSLKSGAFPETVRQIADQYIDSFVGEGKADLHDQFCFDYPISVFVSILGLEMKDVGKVHRWGQDLCLTAFDPLTALNSSQAIYDYLQPIVQHKRNHPSDDIISKLVQSEVQGHKLNDLEVISFLRLLTLAGAETTNHLIGTVFVALLKDPELMQRVQNDRGLVPKIMDEAMRWESPVSTVMRETTCDTEIAGIPVKKNTAIVCHIGSANRDERRFENPDKFDIDRTDNDPIPFGYGRHYCAGSHLAKIEGEIGINALLDRLKNIRVQKDADYSVVGYSFRGPNSVPIEFEPA